jgi:hypothetical protein
MSIMAGCRSWPDVDHGRMSIMLVRLRHGGAVEVEIVTDR